MTERDESDAYRSFVGPADQYDVIGAAQFGLLYALGLREQHRLLDIGCGSLRAGRMLIPYLARGGYTGVDPNRWLFDAALEHEIGHDVLTRKEPRFDSSADFALGHLGRFDFVLAQGMATNTGPGLVRRLLAAISDTLAPHGIAAVTFIHPGTGDGDALEVSLDDSSVPDWRYPGCYSYSRTEVAGAVTAAGLTGQQVGWFHPRHQWWLLTGPQGPALPAAFLATLNGATLAGGWERSWNALSSPPARSLRGP